MIHSPVSVTRDIPQGASTIFDLLANPAMHPVLDGSGLLRDLATPPSRVELHSTFGMRMKQFGIPYRVVNTVTEYESNRRIAWRPWLKVGPIPVTGGVTWRYELQPHPSQETTVVTETYDVTTARMSWFFSALGYPKKMTAAMEATLANIETHLGANNT